MGQTKTEIKQKTQLTFAERLGQEEVENAEANMFRMNEFGGEAEANRLIEKYRAETELTEEEENALIENVPVAPNFTVYTKEEYDSKWNCNKRRYRKKVIKYFDDRRKYYTKKNTGKESGTRTKGQIFARTRRAIEKRIKNKNAGDASIIEDTSFIQEKDNNLILEEKPKADKKATGKATRISEKIEGLKQENERLLAEARKKGYYPDLEEKAHKENKDLPALMDEEFDRLEKMSEEENKDFEETEMKIAENEAIILQSMHKKFTMGVSLWTGECCQTFKTAMHSGNYDKPFVAVKDCLTERPLSRDVVVRRGNCSFNALGLALDADDYTPEEIKKKLQERMDSGQELILNESAMMSTAFPFAKAKYDAGQTSIGIEYIILAKKGTTAVNAIPIAYKNEEGELLIAQNTKFRVIKAQLDGDANIIRGHKQSWKIYLVTVPESTNGVKN